ncbi:MULTISPECIES: MFS transporter [Pseudomonas]|uniref:MFS transporter n=1 Tax=Pseudomonas TaxID=286 RepID=UPI000CD582CE|nr:MULTISPECIES: MFS transporter [Pseudomonas]RBH57596.1 MFS transporter [Pseudomonas sp. MWU13-2860]
MPSPIRSRPGLTQVATCLGFVVVLIDVSVVNVALDALRLAFGANVLDLQWVVNAYGLVFASSLLLAGALGDRFGAKRVFMAGFALFSLASVGCGLATSLAALIGWRVVQGLGAALLVPTSLSLLRQVFEDPVARSRAIGWWGAGGGIALAAGPVLGGVLIESLGWRSIFLINLPIGLIGLWLTARHAPASVAQHGRSLDLPGQVTGVLALGTLTLALTEATELGWSSPTVLGVMGLCIAFSGAFLWLEARNPDAMLPLELFRDRTVSSTTAIGLIINLVFYGMVFTFSLLFQSIWQLTPQRTGLAFLPMMAVLMLMNILAGRLAERLSERVLVMAGLTVSACGYALMLPALAAQSYTLLVVPMLLAGSGIALVIPTITQAVLTAVPANRAGVASGLLNAARQVGGVMGVALFGGLVRHSQPALFMLGMEQALIACVVLLAVSIVTGFLGLKKNPAQRLAGSRAGA